MGLLTQLITESPKIAKGLYDDIYNWYVSRGYPESVAERIASGELDMSSGAIAARRELYPTELYHGSMQDIQGTMKAGYDDGLLFFTPDKQFANDWVGKGKMQTREGELDSFDRYRPQKQAVYEQLGSPEYGTPEYDEFTRITGDIYQQEQNAFKTVYPVRTRLSQTLDPTDDDTYASVIKPIFEGRYGGSIDPNVERQLKQGAYLHYENPDVVKELKRLGYDSMLLSETSDQGLTTVAKFDPYDIKALGAAFDPEYTGPNILGATAGTAGALGLLAAPEEAEAGVSKEAIKAVMAGVRTPQEFLSALERLGASPEQAAQIARGELSPIKAGVSSQNAGLIPTIGRDGELIDARFDPRVNSRIRNAQLETGILSRGTMDDIPRIALSDLEGQKFVTSMSDRTAAGGLLESINGVSLNNLVNLQGGQGFMFENPGMVWASAPNPVNQILDAAGGDNVFYLPWRMSASGGDFATMTGETMLSYASANMGKAEKKALDKIIREYKTTGTWDKETKSYKNAGLNIGEWKGVDDPSSIDAWRNAPDALRKELMNAMDVNFRDKGGLSIGEARLAVTDTKQRFAMDGGIQNVGQIFGGRPAITNSGHPSYPAGVPGQGVGQLDKLDMSIFDLIPDARIGSDQVLVREAVDPTNPNPEALRALQMKPYSGVVTEDILKTLDARGVNVNDLAPYIGGGAALGLLAAPEEADAMESPDIRAALEEAGVIGDTLVPTKRPLGERAMGVVDRILTGLEVPQRGVQGLAATGYGLLSGEDFDTAASRGADVVRQGVDESARQFGDYVFDLTGSPEAATAAYTSGIFGSPL